MTDAPVPVGRLDRFADAFVDRLNPILVREVRQAVNGKGFLITASLALLATVLIGLFAAAAGGSSLRGGSGVFVGTMEVLAIVVLLVVPLHAFVATRQEVTKGTVEHLLLSRLTPGQIVRGKLAAATVQFAMYLGIFSPLLALTFLLRGVSVPTILIALGLALLAGLAACALAVAGGALSRWPGVLRALPSLVVFGALLMLTWGSMAFVASFLFEFTRSVVYEHTLEFIVALLGPALAFIVLCALVGTAALSHPYENRSTGFRIYAFVALGGVFAAMAFLIYPHTLGGGLRVSASEFWYGSTAMASILAIFGLFASTEQPRLTPRVATGLSRNIVLRLLSVVFLPGAGRGLLFTLLLAGAGLLVPVVFERTAGYAPASAEARGIALMGWLYVILYSGIAAFVRARMGPGAKANWIARLVILGVLVLAVVVPLVVQVLTDGLRFHQWTVLQTLDPFATFEAHDGRPHEPRDVIPVLLSIAALAVLVNIVTIIRGILEVVFPRGRRPVSQTEEA